MASELHFPAVAQHAAASSRGRPSFLYLPALGSFPPSPLPLPSATLRCWRGFARPLTVQESVSHHIQPRPREKLNDLCSKCNLPFTGLHPPGSHLLSPGRFQLLNLHNEPPNISSSIVLYNVYPISKQTCIKYASVGAKKYSYFSSHLLTSGLITELTETD